MEKLQLPNGENIFYIDKATAEYIYDEIYIEQQYIQNGIEIHDDDIIFDVGANIGLFTRFISKRAKDLTIFAFEPIKDIFEVFEKNITNLNSTIYAFNYGLGADEKEIPFYFFPKVSGDSTAIPFEWDRKVDLYLANYRETICKDFPIARIIPKFLRKNVVEKGLKNFYKSEEVNGQIRRLSDILKEYGISNINLLKIDAENYEKHVLDGIDDEDWEKIEQIVVEVHQHIKGGENLLNEIEHLLINRGFKTSYGKES